MRAFGLALVAMLTAITISAPVKAATLIGFTLGAADGDFVNARPAQLSDRQINGSGSMQFLSTLTDGTYGLADLATFSLQLQLKFKPTLSPPLFFLTADYSFDRTDLSAFQITYVAGVPISASWTLNPVGFDATNLPTPPSPFSVDFIFDSENELTSFYGWPNGIKTLTATSDGLDNVTFSETAVPEPGTWLMMLFGFGAIGVSLRRSRRPRLAVG